VNQLVSVELGSLSGRSSKPVGQRLGAAPGALSIS
jgi:hypothetical protein